MNVITTFTLSYCFLSNITVDIVTKLPSKNKKNMIVEKLRISI